MLSFMEFLDHLTLLFLFESDVLAFARLPDEAGRSQPIDLRQAIRNQVAGVSVMGEDYHA